MRRQIAAHVRPGDLVVMAEKPIAASQGRSYALDEIHPTRLAKVLSKAVTKTPHGIGLGIPETMQLAIDEAGAPRIVAAAAVSAAGKVVGKRGLFYKVAGADVEAIDGPTWNTLPPHNTHAKLGPADPDGVAAHLADVLSDAAGGRVEFVVIDANDLTATVLGASPGADRALAKRLMRDNPLGQGHEQTPVCVLRPLGPLPSRVQRHAQLSSRRAAAGEVLIRSGEPASPHRRRRPRRARWRRSRRGSRTADGDRARPWRARRRASRIGARGAARRAHDAVDPLRHRRSAGPARSRRRLPATRAGRSPVRAAARRLRLPRARMEAACAWRASARRGLIAHARRARPRTLPQSPQATRIAHRRARQCATVLAKRDRRASRCIRSSAGTYGEGGR